MFSCHLNHNPSYNFQIKDFFESIKEQSSQLRVTQVALENVEKNIMWLERNLETLRTWLLKTLKSLQKKDWISFKKKLHWDHCTSEPTVRLKSTTQRTYSQSNSFVFIFLSILWLLFEFSIMIFFKEYVWWLSAFNTITDFRLIQVFKRMMHLHSTLKIPVLLDFL